MHSQVSHWATRFFYLLILLFFVPLLTYPQSKPGVLYGKATYYHKRFEGRKTANGEKFNHKNFTCANNSLPFNTFLKVRNLDNNKVIVLRVNDRLPKRSKVLLDLTIAAAKELGFVKKGSVNVIAEIIDTTSVGDTLINLFAEASRGMKFKKSKNIPVHDNPLLAEKGSIKNLVKDEPAGIEKSGPDTLSEKENTSEQPIGFGIQVLSYHSKKKAQKVARELEKKYSEPVFVMQKEIKGKIFYRVVIGQYPSKSDLLAVKSKLEKEYSDCYTMKLD